jgi:hypothetical protein
MSVPIGGAARGELRAASRSWALYRGTDHGKLTTQTIATTASTTRLTTAGR